MAREVKPEIIRLPVEKSESGSIGLASKLVKRKSDAGKTEHRYPGIDRRFEPRHRKTNFVRLKEGL